ncbi:hypothetical protein BH09BAC6_BH09BAC6_11750 [soil metagenome]|jgi:glycosyltransferase involved in cell wall biosynthesis
MKFVFVSYVYSKDFDEPKAWLHRIRAYGGILESLAINHTVISIEQINYEGELDHAGVKYYFKRLSKASKWLPFKLHRFISALRPDVVIVQGLIFPLQVIQLRLALRKNVKIIVQNHAEQPFKGFKKRLMRVADAGINAYLFASQAMGMEWIDTRNLADPAKIHQVMEVSSVFYPVKRSVAVAKTGAAGKPVFLWVGRLNNNKDPLNVIKAFLKFANSEQEGHLYMIYHTDELLIAVTALLNESANKNSVTLVGRMPHQDLLYWFNSADFVISGSHYEGSGTAVCEAMSCGCIPIVTDILSFRMITDNGNCGILYEPGSEAALLSALKQTPAMNLAEKQARCLEYFNTQLSFQAIAQQIQQIAASL